MGLLNTWTIFCLLSLIYYVTANVEAKGTEQIQNDEGRHYREGGKEITFSTNPRIILAQITPTLVINCSLDLGQLESLKKDEDRISEVFSISIKRDGSEIAAYRKSKPALSFEGDPDVILEGKFSDKTGSLTMTYSNPTGEKSGAYLCLVGGFDRRGYPLIRTKSFYLDYFNYGQMAADIQNLKTENTKPQNPITFSSMKDALSQIIDTQIKGFDETVKDELSYVNTTMNNEIKKFGEHKEKTAEQIQDLVVKVGVQDVLSVRQFDQINKLQQKFDFNEQKTQETLNKIIEDQNKQIDNLQKALNVTTQRQNEQFSSFQKTIDDLKKELDLQQSKKANIENVTIMMNDLKTEVLSRRQQNKKFN